MCGDWGATLSSGDPGFVKTAARYDQFARMYRMSPSKPSIVPGDPRDQHPSLVPDCRSGEQFPPPDAYSQKAQDIPFSPAIAFQQMLHE